MARSLNFCCGATMKKIQTDSAAKYAARVAFASVKRLAEEMGSELLNRSVLK
jgi:hypothetical protein